MLSRQGGKSTFLLGNVLLCVVCAPLPNVCRCCLGSSRSEIQLVRDKARRISHAAVLFANQIKYLYATENRTRSKRSLPRPWNMFHLRFCGDAFRHISNCYRNSLWWWKYIIFMLYLSFERKCWCVSVKKSSVCVSFEFSAQTRTIYFHNNKLSNRTWSRNGWMTVDYFWHTICSDSRIVFLDIGVATRFRANSIKIWLNHSVSMCACDRAMSNV